MVCRVHTLAMPVVQELAELYRSVDCAASVTLLAKLAIEKSYSAKLGETRNAIQVLQISLHMRQAEICCTNARSSGRTMSTGKELSDACLKYSPIMIRGAMQKPISHCMSIYANELRYIGRHYQLSI